MLFSIQPPQGGDKGGRAAVKEKHKWLWNHRTLADLFVVLVGIAFYLCLSHFDAVRTAVAGFFKVFTPFIWGFALAYLLNRPVRFFERRVYRRCRGRRALSILTVYLIGAALAALLLGLVLPQLVQSVMALVGNVPIYLKNIEAFLDRLSSQYNIDSNIVDQVDKLSSDLMQKVTDLVKTAAPQLLHFSVAVGSGLVTALTAFISSIYMLAGKEKLTFQCKKVLFALMPAPRVRRLLEVLSHANAVFSGFIVGKLIDSAIIGVLCFMVMSILRLPLALLISTIVGVTNVIPFFGPFLGAVPSILILLIVNPWSALWFTVLIIALQQFDGNILGPKILGDSTGLSALWVLVAIIIGGGFFGFAGMLLGVPTFAMLYSLSGVSTPARLRARGVDACGEPLSRPPAETAPGGEENAP